jgi:hypothetical protein
MVLSYHCPRASSLQHLGRPPDLLTWTTAALQDEVLIAYQITFDLVETQMQSFLLEVRTDLS